MFRDIAENTAFVQKHFMGLAGAEHQQVHIPIVVDIAGAGTVAVLFGGGHAQRFGLIDKSQLTVVAELIDEQTVGLTGAVGDVNILVIVPVHVEDHHTGYATRLGWRQSELIEFDSAPFLDDIEQRIALRPDPLIDETVGAAGGNIVECDLRSGLNRRRMNDHGPDQCR